MSSDFSTYDPTDERQSIYCYKGTNILINEEDIRDEKALAEYEADITMIRQYELENECPVKGKFGITHLKRIHKYIFQDVYPFAGELRIEFIAKGNTPFCDSPYIEENLQSLFQQLKNEAYLRDLGPGEFSERAAYYMSELNIIHPFREGNGRSIREFIRQLALERGYIINWSLITKETLLEAIITAVAKSIEPLKNCIFQCIENK